MLNGSAPRCRCEPPCWRLSGRGAPQPPSSPLAAPGLDVVAEATRGRGGGGRKEAALALLLEMREGKGDAEEVVREAPGEEGKGKPVKLLPVLSVVIAALQRPRDI